MKPSGNQFTFASARLMAAAALAATLAFAPTLVLAADPVAHVDRTELRITKMHAKLNHDGVRLRVADKRFIHIDGVC